MNIENNAGKKLMNHVLDLCSKENVSEVYWHVIAGNGDAINFYRKFGFEMAKSIQNFYTFESAIKDCHVFTKRLAVVTEQEDVAEEKVENTDKKYHF